VYYVVDKQMCFVCSQVADMPTPRVPSVRRPCAHCDALMWIPKKSPTASPKICLRCAEPRRLHETRAANVRVTEAT
jgi:hypothetical protein